MGIDIGSRRIGVAISDPSAIIAQPLMTLEATKKGAMPLDELRDLIADRGVEGLVVGLPRRLDGSHGPGAEAAEAAAEELRAETGLRVEMWDERLTSVQAERLLIDAGVRRKQRKGATDRIAAALILQAFLDHQSIEVTEPPEAAGLVEPDVSEP